MLTHNALNLASKTEEVLRYIEIVSVTGKVPSSSMGMLSYGMLEKISTTSIKFNCVRPNKDSIRPRHDNNITLSLRYIFIETSFLEVCCAVISLGLVLQTFLALPSLPTSQFCYCCYYFLKDLPNLAPLLQVVTIDMSRMCACKTL